MSDPYTLYNSYAYKPNVNLNMYRNLNVARGQARPLPRTGNYNTQNPNAGEVSKTTMIIVLVVLAVLIAGWVGLNFYLYEKDEAWFKVYKAPAPPPNSVQPNGDGTGGKLDPAVTTFKNSNLAGYKALAPGTTPSEFGGYITTPPPP